MTQLGDLTWTEIDGRRPLLLVPVGSTEQHGPHLPMATDTLVAVALATALSNGHEHCVVAPAIAIGASGEHREFPGTLSIGTEVLTDVLVEVVRSARSWTTGVVFVSGHGGNRDALNAAQECAEQEGDEVLVLSAATKNGDLHAGRTETSLLLFLASTQVRETALVPGTSGSLRDLFPTLASDGVRAVSPTGILGDPTGASAAEGEELFSDMTKHASEQLLERWKL